MNSFQLKSMTRRLREAAPYLLVELLLPGGTLFAILMWLTQNSTAVRAGAHDLPPSPHAIAERVVDIPMLTYHVGAAAAT
jgi:hypothetical protein